MNHTNFFLASFSELQQTYWLSLREDTYQFLHGDLPDFLQRHFQSGYVRLRDYVRSLRSGEYIEKASYSDHETEFVYVSVNNFSTETPNLDELVFLDPIVGERFNSIALSDGDMIITRSGTVGSVHIFHPPDTKSYIPSHHLTVVKLPQEESRVQFLKFYLQTDFARDFFWAHATGKSQKEITNWSIRRIPIPRTDRFAEIASDCQQIETEIHQLRDQLQNLQDIVDHVFIASHLKSRRLPVRRKTLQCSLESISQQFYLRCGAQYRAFYENHEGLLFDDPKPKYVIVRLSELMHRYRARVLKKGVLTGEYTLLDLEQVDGKSGRIIDETNLVTEIGSDKVEFGEADLIVSKIDPYLGYAFLNDKAKPYIGSTEFLPFSVDRNLALPEYVRYLLLSHEYLYKSGLLMYGKRHPRIHPKDLLNIRVPRPPLDVQNSIVDQIHENERKHQEIRDKITQLRQDIDRILWESLLRDQPEA